VQQTSDYTPAQAFALLQAGNRRFAAGTPESELRTAQVVVPTEGQSPFAIVLGCSDSRVPIETIFDQPAGNVFVVRVAGNFLNEDNLASIEFGVAVLRSNLIVVLGHSHCGAVEAAVGYVKDNVMQPGHIQRLCTAIAPAARAAREREGSWIDNAIVENVKLNVGALTAQSPIVAEAVKAGSIEVKGGVYDLRSGIVAFL
jgi:carbonic anhydrase